ncbi:MAG: hypothetical protein QM760_19735 [Nibricoccus sp.]
MSLSFSALAFRVNWRVAFVCAVLLPVSVQAHRPPDQRTVYDDWMADIRARGAEQAKARAVYTPPKQEWTAGGPQARLEREAREAWEAGERRMRERREAREAAERAREAERRALDQLYDAAKAGDVEALMTLGKRNEDSFSRWGFANTSACGGRAVGRRCGG